MKQKNKIYLDYAATTPLDPAIKKVMEPYWSNDFGNPSSIHSLGRAAKIALEGARKTVAKFFQCRSLEIVFTGSGTESINLAIFGLCRTKFGTNRAELSTAQNRRHIITTKIEHHAVLRSMEALEKDRYEITYLDVDKNGLVNPKKLKSALRPETILVSIMYANNEIGTVEPIVEIGRIIKEYRRTINYKLSIISYLDLNVEKLGVDLMSINGSKIYGPKGVGALYVKSGVKLESIIYGGGQENGLRSGTENIAGIVGFAKALEIA